MSPIILKLFPIEWNEQTPRTSFTDTDQQKQHRVKGMDI